MAECPDCGKPILWALAVNGNKLRLDPKPVPDGNMRLDAGQAVYVPPEQRTGVLYKPHWTSCPPKKGWSEKTPRGQRTTL